MTQQHTLRLEKVRQLMRQSEVDLYFVPTSDRYCNEYVPKIYRRLEWLTGFSGSSGALVVTNQDAFLWTDSRYHIQAETEIDPTLFTLMKHGLKEVMSLEEWLALKFESKTVLGLDFETVTEDWLTRINKLTEQIKFVSVDNFVDQIRDKSASQFIQNLTVYPESLSGESTTSKLNKVYEAYRASSPDLSRTLTSPSSLNSTSESENFYLVITSLDCLAWLLNLRGDAVENSPLFLGYGILNLTAIGKAQSVDTNVLDLYLESANLSGEVKSYIDSLNVNLKLIDQFYTDLSLLKGSCLVDLRVTNAKIYNTLKQSSTCRIKTQNNLIFDLKAIKNSVEQAGMRQAHILDGLAVSRGLCWLEENWNKIDINEIDLELKLLEFRKEDEDFIQPSFPAIVGYGEHGAIVHYRANSNSCRKISAESLLLVDSGAHYSFGTTDVTRTIKLGEPVLKEQIDYTLVLKGLIALTKAVFPNLTDGPMLDCLARMPLWSKGKNYGHGTGHGVGSYLNVHESPPSISPKYRPSPLKSGMVISNEPGYYEAGQYGIRLENLILVKNTKGIGSDDEDFLCFETLTIVPFCRELIHRDLMTVEELEFVNLYHHWVFQQLQSLKDRLPVIERESFYSWLENRCKPIV